MDRKWIESGREELRTRGYTVVPADVIVSTAERQALAAARFNDDRLERDLAHVHPMRERADDVVCFAWTGDAVRMSEAPGNHPDPSRIYVQLTRNFVEARHYRRFAALESGAIASLVETVLRLIPDEERRADGQVGIHTVRTHGLVVPVWHRDGNRRCPVDWVISYVVSKTGAGARTQLATDRSGKDLVAEHELAPGELIMHRDDRYYHYVTPLEPAIEGVLPERAAVVMMVRPVLEAASASHAPRSERRPHEASSRR